MSQSFSAFVMCFCLLLVNLIIFVYLGFWFCFLVVLLSYSWFGRQVWVFNYFFLTSWNFMASPRLHHFSIACSSFNDCFLLYLEPLCFQFLSFWTLWWRSILAAFNAAYLVIVVKIFILHSTCVPDGFNLVKAIVH